MRLIRGYRFYCRLVSATMSKTNRKPPVSSSDCRMAPWRFRRLRGCRCAACTRNHFQYIGRQHPVIAAAPLGAPATTPQRGAIIATPPLPIPLGLLAELTHRCPLGCPYCSNPLALERREDELDAATWGRVFREAAGLGVLQVHLSGGEPAARSDLVEITAAAAAAGLYSNLITSAVGMTARRLAALAEAALDHVQVSIQDSI